MSMHWRTAQAMGIDLVASMKPKRAGNKKLESDENYSSTNGIRKEENGDREDAHDSSALKAHISRSRRRRRPALGI